MPLKFMRKGYVEYPYEYVKILYCGCWAFHFRKLPPNAIPNRYDNPRNVLKLTVFIINKSLKTNHSLTHSLACTKSSKHIK